jgi:DNA invertase Pin-like site-specific DNA recombinase
VGAVFDTITEALWHGEKVELPFGGFEVKRPPRKPRRAWIKNRIRVTYRKRLNIEFISFREQIDAGGPLGRAVVVIIGAIAELERNLIIERVRAGMRRAKLEGRHIGHKPLALDRDAILRDRQRGQSLGQLAKSHRASRATIHRVLREHAQALEKSK